ncbi:ABC transporter permease [Patulibacter sp. NPDC049589]|uniref:ABC transporter permease n=1 Tax=Patulibacter sp. NPDC049589 TaxID=3154731 RepID=UPI003433D52A
MSGRGRTLAAAARLGRVRLGLALVVLVVLVAVVGPLVAPHDPDAFVAPPSSGPASGAALGADVLGRDVLSRFLSGGRAILAMSVLATVAGVGAGAAAGIAAAIRGGWIDELVMRTADVLLAIPQVVLVLLGVAALGPQLWLIVLLVALANAPRVARVARGTALEIAQRDFVRAAEAAGESSLRIATHEVLPSAADALLVEFGLRLTVSIALVASVGFLGFGLQPPASDWGLMINENRLAITAQPWSVVLPVVAVGVLTVGVNLVTDGLSRAAAGLDRAGRA